MNRQEKIRKKQERSSKRKNKRDQKYREFLEYNHEMIDYGGFCAVKGNGIFYRNGKMMQKCSYEAYGICEVPCNGDC